MSRLRTVLVALALTSGCLADTAPGPDFAGPGVAIGVAALNLEGVGDVVWDLEVRNPAQVVWQRRITSSTHGDSAGSASYVGSCDADANPNTVRVWVVGVYDGDISASQAGAFASGSAAGVTGTPLDFQNPTGPSTPLSQQVTCSANADAAVQFDVTLMRPATQGFFDVAVSFNNVFCAAKFDCCDDSNGAPGCDLGGTEDIRLLFDADGARGRTMVLGFACTAGIDGATTALDLDPIALDCTSPAADDFHADLTLDPDPTDLGNQCTPGADGMTACAPRVLQLGTVDPDAVLYQFAIFRGAEALDNAGVPAEKRYWNVALGVKGGANGIRTCWLRTRGTAEDPTTVDDHVVDGVVAAGAVYPFVQWDVNLATCGSEPLTFGDPAAPVRTEYTGTTAGSTTFTYTWSPQGAPSYACPGGCVHGACTGNGVCTCAAGWTGGACTTPICTTACTGNTECTSPNTCTCTAGWTGATCTTPTCTPACTSGYACTAPNVCTPTAPQPCTGVDCNIFSHTGGPQSFVVPAGVTSLTVKLWAGGGGGGGETFDAHPSVGGGGGFAKGTFSVTPGETLTLVVGGGGLHAAYASAYGGGGGSGENGGSYASGGGGRSAVRRGATELVTAGGGGGGGGEIGQNNGGAGGGATGATASGVCYGTGGTQSAGGAGGTCNYITGGAGSALQGGENYCGGGGGGGWFGGGSGNHESPGTSCGGGGGGSGHLGAGVTGTLTAASGATAGASGDVDYAAGVGTGGAYRGNGGHGRIVISY